MNRTDEELILSLLTGRELEGLSEEDLKKIETLSRVMIVKDEAKEQPKVTTAELPYTQLMTIDKVSESMRKELLGYNLQYQVGMEKRGSKDHIDTLVTLTLKDLDMLPPNINEDDIRTLNSLMTFYIAGEEVISLNQLYRVKVRDNKANPNKRQTEKLREQLSKLNQTYIKIDCREEAQKYNYKDLLTAYEGHMISLDIYTGLIKGNETTTISINSISPLFQYALNKNQYIEVPFEVSENSLSRTSKNLALEEYLYKRIKQMSNANNKLKNSSILSDTIISNLNMENSSKTTVSRLYQDIEEVLKAFMLNDFIKDYNPVAKGRRVYYKWEIIL